MRERGTGSYRKLPNGGYQIRCSHRGRRIQRAVSDILRIPASQQTEEHAKRALKAVLGQVWTGQYVAPAAARLDVAKLLDAYVEDRRVAGIKDITNTIAEVERLKRDFSGWKAVDVALPTLQQWATAQLATQARGTVKVKLAYVHAAFVVAKRLGLVPVVPDFPTIAVDNARTGSFTPEEFESVRARLAPPLNQFVAFLYWSGWRPSEALGLKWSDVDRARGVIPLPARRHKGKKAKALPIVGAIERVIEERWKARRVGDRLAEWVFHRHGKPVRDYLYAWRRACADAGLAGRLVYDLKRSAVADMVRAGIAREIGKKNTGHASDAMWDRYAVLEVRDQAAAIVQLEQFRRKDEAASTWQPGKAKG
jgi:integrase